MTCSHCGREAPEGRFCTWCGTHQQAARRSRFAAAPNEAVVSPSLMTTLFPHLVERDVNEFRWALGGGLLLLFGLYLLGLITVAFVVAAILVPVLYVLYLYEARVYGDAPIPVALGTIGGGFVLGLVATIVFDRLVGDRPSIEALPLGQLDLAPLLLPAVFVPIVTEAVKPLPALLLRRRPAFAQSADGLVFGVAAGLGYAAAETIIHFSAVITGLPIRGEPGLWILPLLTVGILMPLLHGSATGLISLALWRVGRGPVPGIAVAAAAIAIIGHIAFVLGGRLLEQAGLSPVIGLVWQGGIVAVLLIAVRLLLDRFIREEAAEAGLSPVSCANCGSSSVAAGFCPACGVALSATPRTSAHDAAEAASSPAGSAR